MPPAAPVTPTIPVHSPASIRPKDEQGMPIGAYLPSKCPTCRHRFNIGPFDRDNPARMEEDYECPDKKCGATHPLYRLIFNPRRERDFFGVRVTCKVKIAPPKDPQNADKKLRIVCGEVYLDKMPGPGGYDAKRDIGGMFRCCPRCGALPPRAKATITGRDDEDDAEPAKAPMGRLSEDQ